MTMENLQLSDHLDRAIAGDVDAFESLILVHQKKVYNIAYHFFYKHEDAQEMAQNAMIKAFQNISNFQKKSSFETWLFRITTNICIDEKRKRQKSEFISLDDKTKEDEYVFREKIPQTVFVLPEGALLKKELQDKIKIALEKLNVESRTVIVLRDIRGLNYDEISEIINVPLGTVKSRINRARQMLREILSTEMELK